MVEHGKKFARSYWTSFFRSVNILLIFAMLWPQLSGERILFIYPLSSKSMANLFDPLSKELLKRDHELTIVGSVPLKVTSPNLTQITSVTADDFTREYPEPFDIRRQQNLFRFPVHVLHKFCHQLYNDKEFRKLEHQKFDVLIVNIMYQDCFAGVMHKIGSPIILFATLPVPSPMTEFTVGNYLPSSFIPNTFTRDFSEQMTFIQRMKNFLFNAYYTVMLEWWAHPIQEEIYRKYLGQDLPSIKEIYKKQVGLVMVNAHPVATFPRPLLPSVVEIGGIHCNPAKPLPKDLEEFASGAKDGFIVFSTGSIIKPSHMPESVRKGFVKTFSKLKQKVIWKWDKDGGMPDLPANVKLVKWLPQQDLLGHPNIRLFITHGGLLSTEEALYHGVPVIGLPVFVDQDANMQQAEIQGFGLKAEILDLTEEKLTPLVRRILDDPRYMQRAKELSRIFRDEPQQPLEKAVFWVEYIMRHKGANHLKSAGLNLNRFQYHSVDVVIFLITMLVSTLFVLYWFVKQLVGKVASSLFLNAKGKRQQVNRTKKRS